MDCRRQYEIEHNQALASAKEKQRHRREFNPREPKRDREEDLDHVRVATPKSNGLEEKLGREYSKTERAELGICAREQEENLDK